MPDPNDQPLSPPPLWPFLLLCAVAAVWIDLGSLHQGQHADSLVPVLVSLCRWTPFYWESDRIGMLVPLLALPFKHPLANVLVQAGANVFCSLAAMILLARYMLRDATYPVVGTLGAALFLLLTPAHCRFEFLAALMYGLWLVLGLGGLLLLEPRAGERHLWLRRCLALVLIVLAHWVYCTTALFLGPLVVFRGLVCRTPARGDGIPPPADLGGRILSWGRRALASETAAALLVLGAGFTIGVLFMHLLGDPRATFGTLPADQWADTLRQLAQQAWINLAPQGWPHALLAGAAGGLALLGCGPVRRQAGPKLRAALALAATAAVLALFMATRTWVQMNLYAYRYLLPSCFLLQAALLALAVGPLCAALGRRARRVAYVLAAAALLLAAGWQYGFPSPAAVRADLEGHHVPTTTGLEPLPDINVADLVASGCTHVAGNYWEVWPVVFSANLTLHERGEKRLLWGVTFRSRPTGRYWRQVPLDAMRVAVPPNEPGLAAHFLNLHGFPPLELAEKRSTFWILRPASVVRKQPRTDVGPTPGS